MSPEVPVSPPDAVGGGGADGDGIRFLRVLAYLVILVAGLKMAGALLIRVLLALLLAIVCIPAVRFLERRRVPDAVAIPAVVLGLLMVLVAFLLIVGGSISSFTGSLDQYQGRVDELIRDVDRLLSQVGVTVDAEEFTAVVDAEAVLGLAARTAETITATLSDVLIVILIVVFMLFEAKALPEKLRHALGGPDADLGAFEEALAQVYGYLAVKTGVSLFTGILVWGLCAVVGVNFPVLWGLVAFLFNFIPNIGSILAAVPATLLCLVQPEPELGPGPALVLVSGYLAVNLSVGSVIEPRLMGRRLGLSPLVVLLSLIFWSWLWGPIGMLLSVPLTTVVKILLEHSAEYRPIAVLLGPRPGPPPES
jgi:predicted PurR-regulated permease PerM